MVKVTIKYRDESRIEDENLDCGCCKVKGGALEITNTDKEKNESIYTFIPLDLIRRVRSVSPLASFNKDASYDRDNR